jgi:hypothetical protein
VRRRGRARHISTTSRSAWLAGCLIALPLFVQLADGDVTLARGHVIARQQGVYLPLAAPAGIALLALGTRRRRVRRPTGAGSSWRTWTWVLIGVILLTALLSVALDRTYPVGAATPYVLQALLPLALLVLLDSRRSSDRSRRSLLKGIEDTTLWLATGLFLLRFVVYFDPQIGYPDTFGGVGVPTSLRFFPTLVAVAVLSRTAALLFPDPTSREARATALSIAPLLGGCGLILVAHSRTALLCAVVASTFLLLRLLRRSLLRGATVVALVALLGAGLSSTGSLTSVERLTQGSGASDENRLGRALRSFELSLDAPLGLRFVPSEEVRTSEGLRLRRVVTAENQLGTFGASAGPVALVACLGLVTALGRLATRRLRYHRGAEVAAAAGLLVLLASCAFQTSMTSAHSGMVFAVLAWLTLHDQRGATDSPARDHTAGGVTEPRDRRSSLRTR